MEVTETEIRTRCTDAVFERGQDYLEERRISRLSRFDQTVTAVVSGTRPYDVTVDLSEAGFDSRCSCPYDGPGTCKHVVAVALSLTDGLPRDEGEQIDDVLEECSIDTLREFLRGELVTNSSLRDRFLARCGEQTPRSADEFCAEVDRLFEKHTGTYEVVFEPIDFSQFFDLAAAHRTRGEYESAATVYRGFVTGLDDNMDLVDGSYDHFSLAFQDALDGYVDCVVKSDFDRQEAIEAFDFLEDRSTSGTDYLRDQFRTAATDLRDRLDHRVDE